MRATGWAKHRNALFHSHQLPLQINPRMQELVLAPLILLNPTIGWTQDHPGMTTTVVVVTIILDSC